MIEQVLADLRGEAAVLKHNGHPLQARAIEQTVEAICKADPVRDLLDWLTEEEAMSRSGRTRDWLRGRFAQWESQHLARHQGKNRRQYRAIIVPVRANLEAARAQGERDARGVA